MLRWWPMFWLVAVALPVSLPSSSLAQIKGEYTMRDNQGRPVARVEKNPYASNEMVVRDVRGRRIGTIQPSTQRSTPNTSNQRLPTK